MAAGKPFSQACENNKRPIAEVLGRVFTRPGLILEIGSGTGQHVVHFAEQMPHLNWQPSDRRQYLPGCRMWLAESGCGNIRPPLALDVLRPWPLDSADGVFSANTAHIMDWAMVRAMFRGVAAILQPGGYFCLYGPFQYAGAHTSDSNARFDANLRGRDPDMGVRDVTDLEHLAASLDTRLVADHAMPANNRLLVWQRCCV